MFTMLEERAIFELKQCNNNKQKPVKLVYHLAGFLVLYHQCITVKRQ